MPDTPDQPATQPRGLRLAAWLLPGPGNVLFGLLLLAGVF